MGTADDQPNAATSVVWCPMNEGDGGVVTDATSTSTGAGSGTGTGTDSGTDSGAGDGTDEPTSTPAPGPAPTGGVWDGSNFGTVQDCSGPRQVPVAYPTTQTTPSFKDGATDYEKLIHLSILFFEAQRSGPLPTTQRVPWRGDAGLHDGCDVGVDLRGGYFDAGDFVKFNFPQAAALTKLAWGALNFRTAYQAAGEWENVLDQIKWGTDYFIKCHSEPNVLYGQVGNGHIDHAHWHRPEEIQYETPAYKIDVNSPGSDLAGETAAALAAASKVFEKAGDTAYSAELLQHAKEDFQLYPCDLEDRFILKIIRRNFLTSPIIIVVLTLKVFPMLDHSIIHSVVIMMNSFWLLFGLQGLLEMLLTLQRRKNCINHLVDLNKKTSILGIISLWHCLFLCMSSPMMINIRQPQKQT